MENGAEEGNTVIMVTAGDEVPGFEMEYQPDPLKQSIADSWPDSMDDSCARQEWDWKPEYDLESMTRDMLAKLRARLLK